MFGATRCNAVNSAVRFKFLQQSRGLRVTVNTVKRGSVIENKDKLWIVTKTSHHQQARGGAHYKLELKEIVSGAKSFERFNSGSSQVEMVELECKSFDYLYAGDGGLHLFDPETFEEHEFSTDLMTANNSIIPFLNDSMKLTVSFYEGKPVLLKTPEKGIFTISDTPPPTSSGGDSSKTISFKPAEFEGCAGATLSVPEFLNIGDKVVVDMQELKYMKKYTL